ncbi:DEAD/DEAH box helicase family protein [Paenibacillus pasadenensis]|uniref:DEAD/DEAH box helicase family protein n=1 Tax=Paenibacillus pasadenensis TaxID=217090 RepID=UPI0004170632|nr:DEAD/DEAH box helicase family protein [Paenibacillus pasadenensis]
MPDIKLITENLVDELIPGIQQASGIYILTSFVMDSGVRILAPHLREALDRGAEVKLLAGDYLFVTQPQALRTLLSIHPSMEARLWRSRGTSFHPKAYLFDYMNGQGKFIVGSSNLSRSAFKMGLEWNLSVNAQLEPFTFQEALDKFTRNFYHDQTSTLTEGVIAAYEQEYMRNRQKYPELVRQIVEEEEADLGGAPGGVGQETSAVGAEEAAASVRSASLTPRPAQAGALEALENALDEGYTRAMVVMATGLGKTYLAAFLARGRFRRVLFVAHREEILLQAKQSFLHVMPDKTAGLYNGFAKEDEAELVFASIYTLGTKRHRERFAPDAFDLIVVDEFHHAASKSYRALLDYFQPAFLLGITATPERLDGKDVYALCDGNVAYQIHFIEAIQKGWLSPFRYYGVYDDTDYSQLTWLGGGYDEAELQAVQLREEMAERIHSAWLRHRQTRTIGFCSSIAQANFLARFFADQGAAAISLSSESSPAQRREAVQRLAAGELDVIFTVDLFNEGVDIPSVDTLLFVRPTQSLTIFTQQVGRGLRLHEGKESCVIVDLIGNYRNADIKLSLFDAGAGEEKGKRSGVLPSVPAGCVIDFETGVIDLLQELARKRQPRKEKLLSAYRALKEELHRRPTYVELHLHGRENSREYKQEFGSYAAFLGWAEELEPQEQAALEGCRGWLLEAESTGMNKSYKMVLLLAMLERGPERWEQPISSREAAPFFHRYLTAKEYRRRADLSDKKMSALVGYDEKKISALIEDMPMSKWSGSSKGLAFLDERGFGFNLEIAPKEREILHRWAREIAEYRLHAYFEKKAR